MIIKWIKSFEFRVAAAIFAAVLVVVAIGFTTYSSLTKIVSGVSESTRRDGKLLLLKEILSDITDAESHSKSFTFTNDNKYLIPYAKSIQSTNRKLIELKRISARDSSGAMVDSLTLLVHRKFRVLNEFIALRDTGRIEVVLSNLSEKISPNATRQEKVRNQKEREDLISRIFNRTRKKPKVIPPTQPGVATFKDVQQEIERLRFLEEENAEDVARTQMLLTEQDKVIMENIRAIFQRLESEERENLARKTAEAERLALSTNQYISAFSIGLTLMLFALGYFMVRNIKKSREYNVQLEMAKTETEQLAEAKELFLANMSHEIRTPLHAITGFSEQLISTDLDPEQKEQLEIIKKSGDHLLKLVNNVLDLTKIHAGKLVEFSDSFQPEDLINDALNVIRPLAAEKNIELNSEIAEDIPSIVSGDPVKFRQILINLLSNAVKFTEVGKVDLQAKVASRDKDMVRIDVKITDTGIGISQDQLETIFDEFVQVSNRGSMKYGGTGLGLTISKKLAEFLGGNLSITSAKGVGTIINIQLPFKVRVNARSVENADYINRHIDLQNKKLLVADDELFNLKLLGVLLKKWNATYVSVSNGRDVLEQYDIADFDAILLDLSMPIMNGFDTAKEIRKMKSEKKAKIPIIALTASAEPEVVGKCKAAGIEYVLTKPYLEDDLLGILSHVLFPDQTQIPLRNGASVKPPEKKAKPGDTYDLRSLKEMAPDDNEFTKEMLETFLGSTDKNLSAMKAALKAGDIQQIRELAHTMAAPCRHLAMNSVVDVLKRIENYSKEDSISNALINEIETLEKKLNKLLPQLQEEVNTL